MRKLSVLRRSFVLFCAIFVMTAGLLLAVPMNSQAEEEAPLYTKPPLPEVNYEPEPYEPVVREGNDALLGSGLVFAVALIAGAAWLDQRKR